MELILNLGECWSGVNAENTYKQDGPSQECLTNDFLKCGPKDKYCVGKQDTNFVYAINGECSLPCINTVSVSEHINMNNLDVRSREKVLVQVVPLEKAGNFPHASY